MNDPRDYGGFNLLYHLYPFVLYTLPWFLFAMAASFLSLMALALLIYAAVKRKEPRG